MARAWHLKSRPSGMPAPDNFELKEIALPEVGDGEVKVRNLWLSVDPYMRGRMNDVKSYVPPFQLDEPMDGGAIGEIVESRVEGLNVGDLVQHMSGWRDEAVIPARMANKLCPEFAGWSSCRQEYARSEHQAFHASGARKYGRYLGQDPRGRLPANHPGLLFRI
jgi:hypothetical protein